MIHIVILGYNHHSMVKGAMENFEATVFLQDRLIKKHLFICEYPIPSKEENKEELTALAKAWSWNLYEIPNKGVMENHNQVIHDIIKMDSDDLYVTFDPDVRMQESGWLSAYREALESDSDAMFCCAAREFHDEEWCVKQHGREIKILPSGLRIAYYKHLLAWSTGCWRASWLNERPRNFQAAHDWYGWTEHADVARLEKHGKKWISLVDYHDFHLGACNQEYTDWKLACAQGRTNLPFDLWLKEGK